MYFILTPLVRGGDGGGFMNKKVLKTMIALIMIFLCAFYVLKIFFPEQFVMVIENERLIMIGNYIDKHLWLYIMISCITNFITYWLYLCAVTRKWRLNWKELITVLIVITVTQGLYNLDPTLSSGINIIAMICLPLISKADLGDVAIVFSFNYLSQLLSTLIRSLPLLLTNVNFMTIFLMTLEQYFWLLLFYLYFNLKKENSNGKSKSTTL